ncbi:4Fe-4S dicluster domain-containing protein [Neomoorella thermoacetica]|uniref:4Fe-4S dicluster domain-containing protein n=1 Tax=Neomoorella thermoacetica TaxID=1525 RepID=UPI00084CB7F9|nr:4Fe-4S dicluster domain-containing protein [Moorella thermoacetica]
MERVELAGSLRRNQALKSQVEAESGVVLSDCYQCGKCSAGCPVAAWMDYTPRQVIRLLQLGLVEEALKSHTPWLCACCQACYTRCPREVNLPRLMEVVRQEARRRGLINEKKVDIFERAFLGTVERYGRAHEMGLIVQYNLQSGQPFKDAMLAPPLLLKGKISLFPMKIKDVAGIKNIFTRVRARGGDRS